MTRPDARDRILDAAVDRLRQRGLTVALDGISLEDAIADSGVSRATAYRRWPNRAEFMRAVLVRMVRSIQLEPESEEDLTAIRTAIDERAGRLDTESGRRTAIVEGFRIATAADHRRLTGSRQWRDYLALRITCGGLPDRELQATLLEELRAAERSFVERRASVYAQVPQALGYRLTPPLSGEAGFTLMAQTTGALMSGLILSAADDPESTFRARAFGSEVEAEWTTASYALTAALLSFLEPDPAAAWDPQRALALLDSPTDLSSAEE